MKEAYLLLPSHNVLEKVDIGGLYIRQEGLAV